MSGMRRLWEQHKRVEQLKERVLSKYHPLVDLWLENDIFPYRTLEEKYF